MTDPAPNPKPPLTIPDHELIRPIGRGSYGEVWLARNVLGEYRAVKIIRRDKFEDDRPYEREFEGIRKYEPISRAHKHQVHVLHVGRAEAGFYYVMELADGFEAGESAHGERNWATYRPRTLRGEARRQGRLPVSRCLDIALKLTDALAHLHGHGLVHRDVKPSNIIFAGGEPKLADIGLVAAADESLTCVGTEGFLPPEGPGKPQADLFALGKVLYEISTGRDRQDFPELPTMLRDDPERRGLEELNEVVLKACDPDLRTRYATARAMHADLELLRMGKSLRQVRRRERWRVRAVQGLALAAGIAVLAIPASRWWQKRQPTARALPVQLQVDHAEFWRVPQMARQFDFSPDGKRLVTAGTNGLTIWEGQTGISRHLVPLGLEGWKPAGLRGAFAMPRWAPDGRQFVYQAVKRTGGTAEEPVETFGLFLVTADTGEARQIGAPMPEPDRASDLCWRSNGQEITLLTKARQLVTVTLDGLRHEWPDAGLAGRVVLLGGYSPDGQWLAVTASRQTPELREEWDIWRLPHLGGESAPVIQRPGLDAYPAWGPGGDTVHFVSAGEQPDSATWSLWEIRIDPKTGLPHGASEEIAVKNGGWFLHPKVVAQGHRLVYAVSEPNPRIWVGEGAVVGQQTEVVRGRDPVLSPDGRTIYFLGATREQPGVFSIDRSGTSESIRKISGMVPPNSGLTRSSLSLSPDGQLLAFCADAGQGPGIFVVGTTGGEPRLIEKAVATDATVPVWSPDGQWLAYPVKDQLVRRSRDGSVREVLAVLYQWQGWTVRWSPDGRHLAALAYARADEFEEKPGVFVVSVADKKVNRLTPVSEDKYKEGLEWHPGGQYLTYMFYGPEAYSAQIRRAYLDGRPTDLMIDQPNHWDYLGVWSPDGRQFFFSSTSTGDEAEPKLHVYDAQTAQITHGLRPGWLPAWSADQRSVVWAVDGVHRYYEVIELGRR